MEEAWEHGREAHRIAGPPKGKALGHGDVVPVPEPQVEELEGEPEADRPWEEKQKFPPVIDEERCAFPAVDKGVDEKDVGPPGKDEEPLPHKFNTENKEGLGDEQTG